MTDTDQPIAHLPHPPQRHVFGPDIRIARELSPSGYEQIERTCANCGAVKITIMSGGRAWRRSADGPQVATSIEPPCDRDAGWK